MKIELELDNIQLGWLEAAVSEFHLKMENAAEAKDYKVEDLEQRRALSLDLWRQVSAYSGLR